MLFFLFISTSLVINAEEILSPNKKVKLEIFTKKTSDKKSFGKVYYRVLYKADSEYVTAPPNSSLGITRNDQHFTDDLKYIGESKATKIHDKYQMICGKRKSCENFGTEKAFHYVNFNNQPLNIVFKIYNDSIVFRYEFSNKSDSLINILNEATTYVFPDSTRRWVQPYNISYEDFFPFSKTGKSVGDQQQWAF